MPKGRTKKSRKPINGEGLFDFLTPRDHYNNTSRKTLEQFGNGEIIGITLSRAPVQKFLRKAMDWITFGKFEDALRKYGYDRIFHLSAIVDLKVGGVQRRVVIEKNAVINITTAFKHEADAEYCRVALHSKLTLAVMMQKTQQAMGSKYFFYDPFDNNCQHFIQAMLIANDILTPAINGWLFQDMSVVKQQVSGLSRSIATGITTLGAVADRMIGNGKPATDLEVLINDLLDALEQ